MPTILVINCGSSSLKYQYIDTVSGKVLAKGIYGKIGEPIGQREHKSDRYNVKDSEKITDHTVAVSLALESIVKSGFDIFHEHPLAVGHRVVNGGSTLGEPTVIDPHVMEALYAAIPLAPLHNSANITGIEICQKILPSVPQVAVFDTGFFRNLPEANRTYAISQELNSRHHIRRYGFHGTSHQYVSEVAAEFLQKDYTQLNQIVFHLGNGASVSAIAGGNPIDTSMGLTPLEGLVMGTRSGDIDPALVAFLARVEKLSAEEVEMLLNKESGLKGLCGNNDMREVRQLQLSGDAAADLAIKVYVHQIRKYLGAYWLELNKLDTIVFTAGVGENAEWLRSEILAGLESWGVKLDPSLNEARVLDPHKISASDSTVTVLVIPTNEELMIAKSAEKVCGTGSDQS